MVDDNVKVNIDGKDYMIGRDFNFLKFLELNNIKVPHVCYQENLGPIETCDVCIVEMDGKLVRSCSLKPADGMKVITDSRRAKEAQIEATDRILKNHDLYCTICDSLNFDSMLLMPMTGPIPRNGSRDLTDFTISCFVLSEKDVKNPASPSMGFSISAFTGQTVTQCPQDTHDESFTGTSLSQMTLGTSLFQSIESVSLTCTSWHASTHLPHRMHWFGSYL